MYLVLYVEDAGVPADGVAIPMSNDVIAGSLRKAWKQPFGRGGGAPPAGLRRHRGGHHARMVLPAAGLRGGPAASRFTLIGAGLGTASVASTQTGTDAADPAYRGVTSGVLNSAAQVGTAVGVALLVPLAAATAGPAVMTGYRIGFLGAGAIALAGAPEQPSGTGPSDL